MKSSIFMFATDLHDEGFGNVLENVRGRAGLDGVTLACSYHHARDVFPHNPVRKVRFLEGGAVFFRPDARRYAGLKIQPHVSRLAEEVDVLGLLMSEAGRRGVAVRAWTVYLHNSTLGARHPDCTVQNAFGDPYLTYLCPANPDIRAYACALSADIARYGVQAILAESLSYHPFDHGYHHERCFIPLPPLAKFLLSLCFCPHCLRTVERQGVDGERVRAYVRAELERVFNRERGPLDRDDLTPESISTPLGGEVARFIAARQTAVTTLAAEIAGVVADAGDTHFMFMDMSGAAKGYATGEPAGDPAPANAWLDGVDLPAIIPAVHGLEAVGYARDPERLRLDVEAYKQISSGAVPLSVALRPMLPDCGSPENLAAKVALCRQLGIEWIDFYHYGFMRLDALDWIRQALAS